MGQWCNGAQVRSRVVGQLGVVQPCPTRCHHPTVHSLSVGQLHRLEASLAELTDAAKALGSDRQFPLARATSDLDPSVALFGRSDEYFAQPSRPPMYLAGSFIQLSYLDAVVERPRDPEHEPHTRRNAAGLAVPRADGLHCMLSAPRATCRHGLAASLSGLKFCLSTQLKSPVLSLTL